MQYFVQTITALCGEAEASWSIKCHLAEAALGPDVLSEQLSLVQYSNVNLLNHAEL